MKKIILLLFFIGTGAIITQVKAQNVLRQEDKAFLANTLSGTVVDANGSPMTGVQVKRTASDWMKVIAVRDTDDNGRFTFNIRRPGTYFLRFFAGGFQDYAVKVKIVTGKRAGPKFSLRVGT
jgi:hypothetical protein